MATSKTLKRMQEVFRTIIRANDDGITAEDIAEETGYSVDEVKELAKIPIKHGVVEHSKGLYISKV